MAIEGSNRVTRLPAATPAILRRHPALLVEWLRLANWLSRWREEGMRAAVFALGAVVIAAALLTALSGHAAAAIETLARYWLLVAAMAAIYAWTTVSRRRRHIEESQSQSWLMATPISLASLRLSLAIRTLLPVVLLLVAVVIFAVAVALLNHSVAAAVGTVISALSGGLLIGAAAGWWTAGRGPKQSGAVASRYVPRLRTRSMRPDASALAHWPIFQVLSWGRPENSRYVMIAALFAVQGGSSAITGLSVVAMYFIASYLGALISAMTTVAKSAASWLRSTPMGLGQFVWSLAYRALAHQIVGTALAVVFMSLLGAPLVMALQIAALWLGLAISISGFALVDNYRGRSPLVKIAVSLATLTTLATMLHLRAGAKA